MIVLSLLLAAVVLLLPIGLIVTLARRRPEAKVDWLLTAIGTVAFTAYALLVGRWDLVSYYLRPVVACGMAFPTWARAVRAPS